MAIFRVIGTGRNRQVARRAARAIMHPSGMRPTTCLMQAYGEDPRIIVKRILNPVAVMSIYVEVDDAGQAVIEPGHDPERRVVQVTKT